MYNRRGVPPLQPTALAGGLGGGMPPPSPARSNQINNGQPPTPTSTSPSRRTPLSRYKNSSDSVAAVLGGSTSSSGGFTPVRVIPNGSNSQPRGHSTPPAPNRPSSLPGLGAVSSGSGSAFSPTMPLRQSSAGLLASVSSTPGTPSSSAPLQYEFKVLSSSGKTSQLPVQLFVGSGGLQGFRPTMEDEHFNLISAATTPDGQPVSLFGILDGHCGRRVAELGMRFVPECFLAHPAMGSNNALALAESIVQADRSVFQTIGKTDGGSTLITAVVQGRMLFVACLGDARAVVYDGVTTIPMSEDHKPADIKEQQRIVRCGGTVQFGRVCGCLAVSRALGDYEFKFTGTRFTNQRELMVSNLADVKQINITDATKFIVLGCDGVWDVLSNEEATRFVVDFLKRIGVEKLRSSDPTRVLDDCALKLADYAIERGSMDNVSVTIVFFHDIAQTMAQEPAPSSGAANGTSISSSSSSSQFQLGSPSGAGGPALYGLQRGGAPPQNQYHTPSSPQKRTPLVGRRY
ncbi:protein phosphatase 2C, putative [Bodo saltans]|uniref:Protein phosphatase 2C, putative n=1 Tax=Bodo saltans TaxID=75058 RepID=A0A0S4J8Y7_BODSA|nr:protein phosphatase 2C, putative [Bodo saltans]|eukprot:CUG84911.1 protein phosphatase 2C, putative [Bodo saltans]